MHCYWEFSAQKRISTANSLNNEVMITRLFRYGALVLAFLALPAAVLAEPDSPETSDLGGKGSLRLAGVQETCLKGSKMVPEVCGQIQVNWKLWTLMGEPMGDFVVGWKPTTVRIANASGDGSLIYKAEALPDMLRRAAQAMELYVDAVAFVQNPPASSNYRVVALSFNTGVASKPGETSMNVTGGYNWDRFLHGGMSTSGVMLGMTGWCVEKGREDLNAKDAKAVMRAGVKLESLALCPKSSVNVSPIERAIDKTCESAFAETALGASAHFCAKKEVKKPNVIDDAFARLEGRKPAEIAKPKVNTTDPMASKFESAEAERSLREASLVRLTAEQRARDEAAVRQARRLGVAQNSCKADKEVQDSCVAKTCGRKPDATVCTRSEREPTQPCMGGPGVSCIVFPKYTCMAHGPNPKLSEWESCSANLESTCATDGKVVKTIDACVAERLR